MNDYIECLEKLNHTDLIKYLGDDMYELILEWFPDNDTLITKHRLANMIASIYGTSIFCDERLRKDLLMTMGKTELYSMRDHFLRGEEKTIDDPILIIDCIAKKPWANNRLSNYLASKWGLSPTIFTKPKYEVVVDNVIDSSENQFYELLDYQFYIKQRVLSNLNSGYLLERMLVHMPTGTGKTKTTMHIIVNYLNFSIKKKGAVLWIAHTTELLQQAYDTFCNVWGHLGEGEIHAYKLWGTKSLSSSEPINGVIFCGLAKLMSIYKSNKSLYDRLKRDCRLIVFDEAHKAAAKQTKIIIEDLMTKPPGYEDRAMIGLTATPGRTTEASYDNNLLSNMFGNKLISIDSSVLNQINLGPLKALNTMAENNIIKYFQERKILAKMHPERLTYQTEFSNQQLKVLHGNLKNLGFSEEDFTDAQIEVLATNKNRNLQILKRLRELDVNKIPTIVFACSVNHAKMLSAMLNLEKIKNRLVIGDMDPSERKSAIEDFKNINSDVNIIINYEVLTTGFDSKNIRCVFITRPTKSIVLYSQMLGRGLRGPLMGGNEECLLIDIDDNLKAFNNETAFSHFNDYWRIGD